MTRCIKISSFCRLCSGAISATYDHYDMLLFAFVSDQSNTGNGFKVAFKEISGTTAPAAI
jgi:hypothetical protein